jgi:hypothetical protein
MVRFRGFAIPEGVLVLDSWTGEVRLVSAEGERVVGAARTTPAESSVGLIVSSGAGDALQATPPLAASDAPSHARSPESDQGLELPSGVDDLDREVVFTFPYPIARPYLDLLRETDPRNRCKTLVDTFTAVLKVWALMVASEYLRAPEVKDAQVHQTLVRDLARPLISAWDKLLERTLPVLRDARIAPFAPELGRAYAQVSSNKRQGMQTPERPVHPAKT